MTVINQMVQQHWALVFFEQMLTLLSNQTIIATETKTGTSKNKIL